jgi:hypothetical protein
LLAGAAPKKSAVRRSLRGSAPRAHDAETRFADCADWRRCGAIEQRNGGASQKAVIVTHAAQTIYAGLAEQNIKPELLMSTKVLAQAFTLNAADLANFLANCKGHGDLHEIPVRCFGRCIASVRLLQHTHVDGGKEHEIEFYALAMSNGDSGIGD